MNRHYTLALLCWITYHGISFSSQPSNNEFDNLLQIAAQQTAVKEAMNIHELFEKAGRLHEEIAALSNKTLTAAFPAEQFIEIWLKPALEKQTALLNIVKQEYALLFDIQQQVNFIDKLYQHIKTEKELMQERLTLNKGLSEAFERIGNQLIKAESIVLAIQTNKSNAENYIHNTERIVKQSIADIIVMSRKNNATMETFARDVHLNAETRSVRECALAMTKELSNIEQHISAISQDSALIVEAEQAAQIAQDIVVNIFPLSPLEEMQKKQQWTEEIEQRVAKLVPTQPTPPTVPPISSGGVPGTPSGEPALPPSGTVAPTRGAAPQPPIGPPGKANENINKANSKLQSALRRLDAIKVYFKEITADEKKAIIDKATKIMMEYKAGIADFADRIRQVKSERGIQLDPKKLEPFDTFIILTDKLNNKIKSL